MFDENSPHVVFPNVKVLDTWTSKKGTPCAKVGWLTNSGAGDQTFYGEDAQKLTKGSTVTIRANRDGDFFRNLEVAPSTPESFAEESVGSRRRRTAAA